MSNFSAPTRRIGSNDEFREAVWYDNHFRGGLTRASRFGVRFRGEIDFHHGEDYEIKDVTAE